MIWFFLVMTAVFFIAVETVFEKKTLAKARSFEFAAMFAFGNAVVTIPLIFVADFSQINPFILAIIFLASIPSTLASLLVFKTIKHNQLSEAAPILALMPLVVTLFAYILLGEKMTSMQLSGILFMVGGMVLLELKNFKLRSGIFLKGRQKYIYYILLYLLVGGVSAMFDRAILFRYKVDPLPYLIFIQIFIAGNYTCFFFLKPREKGELKKTMKESWKIFFFVSLLTVSHRYMYASAIQLAVSMGAVAAVYKLSSLVHVFSGGKFFAEDEILRKTVASVVILSGTIMVVIR